MSQNIFNIEHGTAAALDIASHGTGGDTAYIGVKKSSGGGLTIGISNRDIIFKTGATYSSGTVFDSGNEKVRITSGGLLQLNNDSAKIQLGASQDLSIYHDGSSNRIIAANADFILQSNNYNIRSENGSSTYLNIDSSGRLLTGGATVSQGSTNADDLQIGANNQSNQTGITLGSASGSSIRFADAAADSQGAIAYYHSDDTMRFSTGGTTRFRIDGDGVMAYGPFASFAYSNIAGFFHVHSGARVNTGGAQQYAAPKGGFVDNARYELEASLISYSTSAQQTIQALNGAQLKIHTNRQNWSHYNNLPNYLLGHPATDCINISGYTLTLKATMTVFLQRTNSWNAVPLSGWELLESNTSIYPGNVDSRLYVKTLAAGSYTGWDSDSAMYFFML